MSNTRKKDLQQKLESLYAPMEAANISFFYSQSEENERVVLQLEESINALVDELIGLDDIEVQV